MKKVFHTLKKRTVTDIIPFTKEQFLEMMQEKPTEIFNGEWTHRMPFVIITEYNDAGLKYYCNGHADRTPEQKTIEELYNFLKNGLSDCYIISGAVGEKINS